jgi:chemotaxis-related protein WspB
VLFLIFKIENEKYAIPAKEIVEVVDLVHFTKIPQTPGYIKGLMNYRGKVLPVIDLPFLFLKRDFKPMLSTRIILMNYKVKKRIEIIGVVAENITETLNFDKNSIKKSGIKLDTLPYLGKVISNNNEIIHILEITKILPKELKNSLFKEYKK